MPQVAGVLFLAQDGAPTVNGNKLLDACKKDTRPSGEPPVEAAVTES